MATLQPVRSFTVTRLEAVCIYSGATVPFTIEHEGTHVQRILSELGTPLSPSSEQYTETALAFELDQHRHLLAVGQGVSVRVHP